MNRKIINIIEDFNNDIKTINYVYNLVSKDNEGYEGELKDNLPNGYGKRIWDRKALVKGNLFEFYSVYDGNWQEGHFHGYGKLICYSIKAKAKDKIDACYEGNYNMGKKEGYGIFYIEHIGTIEGDFINDDIIGFAKVKYTNGDDGIVNVNKVKEK